MGKTNCGKYCLWWKNSTANCDLPAHRRWSARPRPPEKLSKPRFQCGGRGYRKPPSIRPDERDEFRRQIQNNPKMNQLKYMLPLFLLICIKANAQQQKFTTTGYIKDLYMYYKPGSPLSGIDANHLSSNLIHNRLN